MKNNNPRKMFALGKMQNKFHLWNILGRECLTRRYRRRNNNMDITGTRPSFAKRHRPSILVIASQISAAVIHGIVKVLETGAQPVHPFQVLHIRLLITGLGCTLYLWSRGVDDFLLGPRNARYLLLMRALGGVCGAIGFYCMNNPV